MWFYFNSVLGFLENPKAITIDLTCDAITSLNAALPIQENIFDPIKLAKKYVLKKKLRANFLKTKIITSQRAKGSFVVVLKQV
jgi:hypothetical protein